MSLLISCPEDGTKALPLLWIKLQGYLGIDVFLQQTLLWSLLITVAMMTLAGFSVRLVGQTDNYRCPISETTCWRLAHDLHLQPHHPPALSRNGYHPLSPGRTAVLWLSSNYKWVLQIRLKSFPNIQTLVFPLALSQFSPFLFSYRMNELDHCLDFLTTCSL